MWANVRRYAGAMTKGDEAKLLERARSASEEVEALEASLAAALEQRNALFLEIASQGVSASRISAAVGGRLGTSGVRYGILKAQQSR